jgi:DNA repair exonuclease SbcCD ATPase subunit
LGKDVDIKKEEKKKAEFILMSKTAYENVQQISDRIESFKIENLEPLTQEEHNINLKIDELNSSVTKVKQEINNLNLKIQELEYNIVSHNRKIDNYNRAIKDFENSIVGIENEIKVLKEKPIKANPVVIEIKDKIKDLNNELKSRNSELEDLNNQLQEVTSWVFNFKRFQLYLAEKSIKVIQGNCNSYLNKMRSDLRVKVEGFKIKADKSIKEEITPYVLRGDKLRNFGSFSGGERGRMEYAMILALQNVINSTNKYGGLQFLMTDEAIEGLDSLGLDNVVESLQVFNFPILITTHIQNQKNFDNVLMVEMENGVSRILNN